MQSDINNIKNALQNLAYLKSKRALACGSFDFERVFLLLPSLFHFNHPNLPGYVNTMTPTGVFNYYPNEEVRCYLKKQFNFCPEYDEHLSAISALYSMGSTCSLGQSYDSDLDIWVCIEKKLTESQRLLLNQKCRLIEDWAKQQQIKLTLFVVDANRFIANHHDCLIDENCGSAQHILLLEEFYRTATLLAGKLILWFAIPEDLIIEGIQYESYSDCKEALIKFNLIDQNEWIDFGSLTNLSAKEYFGAGLWQLYKSIDSPIKAVLKTVLLEAYSRLYPENHPIAVELKQLIAHAKIDSYELDPYYMLLDRISQYLIEIKDFQRLKLVRSCFYLKINQKLSKKQIETCWQRQIISDLVEQWGWNDSYLTILDASKKWKIEQAREIHEILLQTMMTSYRNLLNFGRRNNLDSLVSPQDLTVLTRKLYAAFEILPGKVTELKLNISTNLQEKALTFIHVKQDRINRAGWYVYNKKPIFSSIITHQYIEYSKYLVKLAAWCYFNRLIDHNTEFFYFDGDDHNKSKIAHLIHDLKNYFPIEALPIKEEQLSAPCEIRHLAIILNLEEDPTAEMDIGYEISTNVLNYGKYELNLVGSVDLLYRNSWNEIRVLHFNGQLGVLEAIKTLLNRMHKDADIPDSIEIFCYSQYLSRQITKQIKQLFADCVDVRLSTSRSNSTQVKPLRINRSSWYLFFERLGVSFHQFESAIDFYGAVSNHKVQGRALDILDQTNELPKEIDNIAHEGIIQFFFEDTQSGFDLYILNEHNQIEIYRNCNGNKQTMVKDINDFYVLSDDRFSFSTSNSVNFNLPQFYQIAYKVDGSREIMPLN